MESKKLASAILPILALLSLSKPIEGKFLAMRPMTAGEVYRVLHESGRSDAVPQGRVITQGLAAMTGFAIGLTKGLGGAFIYDVITANVTDLDLLGINGNSGTNQLTTQEICFNSRNARSLEEAEAIAEAYTRASDKKPKRKNKVRPSEAERHLTLERRNKKRNYPKLRKKSSHLRANPTGDFDTVTATETDNPERILTNTNNPATTATTATSPTNTAVTTGTGTNVDDGAGTGTTSTSTTSTGNEGAINCIVIQKPAVG